MSDTAPSPSQIIEALADQFAHDDDRSDLAASLLVALRDQHRTAQQYVIGTLKILIEGYANLDRTTEVDIRNGCAYEWARHVRKITESPSPLPLLPGRLPLY